MPQLGPYLFAALLSLGTLASMVVLARKIRARARLHFGAIERRLDGLERRVAHGAAAPERTSKDEGSLSELSALVHRGVQTGRFDEAVAQRLLAYLSDLERELRES